MRTLILALMLSLCLPANASAYPETHTTFHQKKQINAGVDCSLHRGEEIILMEGGRQVAVLKFLKSLGDEYVILMNRKEKISIPSEKPAYAFSINLGDHRIYTVRLTLVAKDLVGIRFVKN